MTVDFNAACGSWSATRRSRSSGIVAGVASYALLMLI